MRVVGRNNVKYTSKRTNNLVEGISLHLVGTRPNVEGEAVEMVFISAKSTTFETCATIPIGTEVNVFYNRYGNVDCIEPISKK